MEVLIKERTAIDVNGLVSAGLATRHRYAGDIGSVSNLFDQGISCQMNALSHATDQPTRRRRSRVRRGADDPAVPLLRSRPAPSRPPTTSGSRWPTRKADLTSQTGSYHELYSAAQALKPVGHLADPRERRLGEIVKADDDAAQRRQLPPPVRLHDHRPGFDRHHRAGRPPSRRRATKRTPGGTGKFLEVTYTDPSAIDVTTLLTGNLTLTGPGGITVTPALQRRRRLPDRHAPHGAVLVRVPRRYNWDSTDNGTYTLKLNPGQVRDVPGNAAATAATLGTSPSPCSTRDASAG